MTDHLDTVFSALADPTRRAILSMLLEDDMAVTDVAEPFEMFLAAISKHLTILTSAGLIHKVESLNAYLACVHSHDDGGAELYICETCSRVQETHVKTPSLEGPEAFQIHRSVIEHYGTCSQCQDGQAS